MDHGTADHGTAELNNITFFLHQYCSFNNLSAFSVYFRDSILCSQDICLIVNKNCKHVISRSSSAFSLGKLHPETFQSLEEIFEVCGGLAHQCDQIY